jgi:hypothetical protein
MVVLRIFYWVDSKRELRSIYWVELIDSDYLVSRDGYLIDREIFSEYF